MRLSGASLEFEVLMIVTPLRTVLGVVALVAVGSLAFMASSPKAQAPGGDAGSSAQVAAKVVATVDGVSITQDELDEAVGAELGRLEQQAFELRQRKLDALVAEKLIASEAARRGMTAEALAKAEVDGKIAPVTDEEITRFFDANKARLPNSPNIRDQIKQYLEMQRREDARGEFVESLRAKAKVAITLTAPPVRRARVDVGSSPVRGEASAPVTIVEFSDFHCPYCRTVQPTLLQVLDRYPGKVRLVYKDLPLDGLHPNARRASIAARCAGEQGRFWQFHDALYSGSTGTDTSPETMKGIAEKIGIDVASFAQCAQSERHAAGIQQDMAQAEKLGLSGTPAFFVNGRLLTGAQPLEGFAKVIEEELSR
jgi:protein-disulfide isomerase